MEIFDEDEPNIEEIEELIDNKDIKGLVNVLGNVYSYYKIETIVKSLGEIGNDRALKPLIKSLKYENRRKIRKYIVEALLKIGNGRAVQPLINALKNVDHYYHYIRNDILKVLIKIGEPAVEPLIDSLNDEDYNIRKDAAEALGNIGDERAVVPLIGALEDIEHKVRLASIIALGKIGDERAVVPLVKTLKDNSSNRSIKQETVKSLKRLKQKKSENR